jgi:hypothetical protein
LNHAILPKPDFEGFMKRQKKMFKKIRIAIQKKYTKIQNIHILL